MRPTSPEHTTLSPSLCASNTAMTDHPSANSLSVARWLTEFVLIASTLAALPLVSGTTDASDVRALQVLYTSVNSPSQLTGWKSSGGDPCGESWKGVTCEGSAVVSVEVSGLGLSGTMGYLLSDLLSLLKLDLSDNNFHDTIPYQLPPNLTSLNLARNNFTGNLPYSMANMVSLSYLNVSRNSLSESIGDIFAQLAGLATLDLSLNNFTSDIPNSFSSLSNLSSLYMQNNQLTGTLNVLTGLPLTTLNVANNHFSGWIPQELSSIRTFIYDGNGFDNGPAPPPPPYIPPPPGRSTKNRSRSGSRTPPQGSDGQSHDSKNGLAVGALVGIILGSVFVALIVLLALAFCIRKNKREDKIPRASGGNVSARTNNVNTEMQEQRVKSAATVTDLMPPPAEILVVDRLHSKNGSIKRIKSPITATPYTVASLQSATNSFSQEFLIGEGSLGRVYRAEFPNGKLLTRVFKERLKGKMVMIRNLSRSLGRSAIAKTLLSPSNSRPSSSSSSAHSAIPLLAPLAGQRLRNNSAAFEPEFRDATTSTTRCLHSNASLGGGGGLPSSMRAAVFREPNKPLTFEEFHIPRPKSGELLIKTKACGVCHSDLHVMKGELPFASPCVVGHEITGEVVEHGPATDTKTIARLPIGSRVVGAFIMPCGNCSYCSKGHDDLCEDFFAYNRAKGTLYDGETRLFLRSSGEPVYMYSMGGLAEYCVVPANGLTILPESLPYIESAVLGCAVFTAYGTMANAAQVKPGDSVAVIGIGGVGSSCLQIARAFGASDIIAVDVQDEKVQKAKIFGATHAVNAAKEDAVGKIMEITGGKGVDIAVEALGRPQTFLQCVQSVKDGGKAVMVGLSQAGAVGEVDINRLVRRKIQIIGSYGGRARQDLPKLVRLAESGVFDLANAVSRRYKFEESNEAFQELNKGSIVGRAVVEIM